MVDEIKKDFSGVEIIPETKELDTKEMEIREQSWLDKEAESINKNTVEGEFPPALVVPENKIMCVKVDYSKPFGNWEDTTGAKPVVKALIPVDVDVDVDVEGKPKRFTFWLNKRNPLYKDIIQGGRNGQNTYKFMRTGTQKDTKYVLIKE